MSITKCCEVCQNNEVQHRQTSLKTDLYIIFLMEIIEIADYRDRTKTREAPCIKI